MIRTAGTGNSTHRHLWLSGWYCRPFHSTWETVEKRKMYLYRSWPPLQRHRCCSGRHWCCRAATAREPCNRHHCRYDGDYRLLTALAVPETSIAVEISQPRPRPIAGPGSDCSDSFLSLLPRTPFSTPESLPSWPDGYKRSCKRPYIRAYTEEQSWCMHTYTYIQTQIQIYPILKTEYTNEH